MRVCFLLLGVCAAFWVAPAHARLSLSVAPTRLDLEVEPGGATTAAIVVKNGGSSPTGVVVNVWDWFVDSDGNRQVRDPNEARPPIAAWVTIRPQRMVLQPGQVRQFQVLVSMPREAKAGNYGQLFVSTTTPDQETAKQAASMTAAVGVQLLVRAKGTVGELGMKILKVKPPTPSENLKVAVKLENTGAVHLWAEPGANIVGPMGDFVGHIVPDIKESLLLLPKQTQVIEMTWPGDLAPATYELFATAYYGAEGLAVDNTKFKVKDVQQKVARSPQKSPPAASIKKDRPRIEEPSSQPNKARKKKSRKRRKRRGRRNRRGR